MKLIATLAVVPALLLATAATAAPSQPGDIELGAYGGFTQLSADNQLGNAADPKMRPGSGPAVGVRASFALSGLLAAEAEVDGTFGKYADSGLSSAIVGGRGSLLWHLGAGTLRPFMLVGGGAVATTYKEHGTEHDVDLAGHAGAGVKYDVTPSLALRADLRWFALDGATDGLAHNFAAFAGVSLRLGGAPPAPPPVAAPPPAPVPVVLPAVVTPVVVLDSDKDGVSDPSDKCPTQGGQPEDDGCPLADQDGDGIADKFDKCPEQKETFNGKDDGDGCPDGIETVVVSKDALEIKQKVYFEPGRSDIKAESLPLLNVVATVLKQHAHLTRVAIEGHTDDLGVAADNQALSQQRAEAVVSHLVGQGLPPGRVVAEGLGATRPLCPDLAALMTKEAKNKKKIDLCREQNRRVQFRVVEVDGKAL